MCKKLLVFMLVLCFIGSASAVTVYTYTPMAGYRGSTCDPPYCVDCNGLKHTTSTLYAGVWTTCGGVMCGMTGWAGFDVPDLGGEQIIGAEVQLYHGDSGGSTSVIIGARYASDDSWTPATIRGDHPVEADEVWATEGAGRWSGVYWKNLDITSWFGPGKESITGGEMLTVQINESPAWVGPPPWGNYYGARVWPTMYLVITTPEPATIALLGLGGLALLRRKR